MPQANTKERGKTPPSTQFLFRRRSKHTLWHTMEGGWVALAGMGGGDKSAQYSTRNTSKAAVVPRTLSSKLLHDAAFSFIVGWALSGKIETRGGRKAHAHKGTERKATETCYPTLGTLGSGCLFLGEQFTRAHRVV